MGRALDLSCEGDALREQGDPTGEHQANSGIYNDPSTHLLRGPGFACLRWTHSNFQCLFAIPH